MKPTFTRILLGIALFSALSSSLASETVWRTITCNISFVPYEVGSRQLFAVTVSNQDLPNLAAKVNPNEPAASSWTVNGNVNTITFDENGNTKLVQACGSSYFNVYTIDEVYTKVEVNAIKKTFESQVKNLKTQLENSLVTFNTGKLTETLKKQIQMDFEKKFNERLKLVDDSWNTRFSALEAEVKRLKATPK